MECGIVTSPIRNHVNESSSLERREGERQRAHQQVKVLKKFSAFGDINGLRMMRERDSEFEPKSQAQAQAQEQEQVGTNYVLRENPKKSKRFADIKELRVCKECGKGFQSLKALCGHMACHSDKERAINNKLKEEKLVMDFHSDTESSGPKLRRVSRRIRYKSVGGSVVEQEQEEVAISLMLLSRDCGSKFGLNSVGESSSNDSVVLEEKSSSIDMKFKSFGEGFFVAEKSGEKLRSDDSENSDSGYFKNGPKKIESDASSAERFGVEKVGISVERSKLGGTIKDQGKICSLKYELRKRTRSTIYKNNNENESEKLCKTSQKRSKYECLTCNKTFHSHTALGGHRASHAKTNGCVDSTHNNSEENSIESHDDHINKLARKKEAKKAQFDRKSVPKKSKGHECPICFRLFKSGQALGGHKRSHFVGTREANSTTMSRQEVAPEPEITILFDLNLPPAPGEDELDGENGFMAL